MNNQKQSTRDKAKAKRQDTACPNHGTDNEQEGIARQEARTDKSTVCSTGSPAMPGELIDEIVRRIKELDPDAPGDTE